MTSISLPWLLGFIAKGYKQVPEDLGIKIESNGKDGVAINTYRNRSGRDVELCKNKRKTRNGYGVAIDAKDKIGDCVSCR